MYIKMSTQNKMLKLKTVTSFSQENYILQII